MSRNCHRCAEPCDSCMDAYTETHPPSTERGPLSDAEVLAAIKEMRKR